MTRWTEEKSGVSRPCAHLIMFHVGFEGRSFCQSLIGSWNSVGSALSKVRNNFAQIIGWYGDLLGAGTELCWSGCRISSTETPGMAANC